MLTIWTTCMVVMVGALCASGMASGRPVQLLFSNDDSVMRERFSLYEKTFHKRYTTDMERERRYTAYCYNMKRAVELAALNPHATFGETSMSDVDVRSWPRLATLATPSVATPTTTDEPLPVEVNWATRGGVTPVQNMGQCGDGCSFSVTGTIEGTWFAATNKLVPLSAQELTSCVSDAWGGGCNGCSNSADYEYILHNKSGKIATNASFPYTSGGGNVPQCKQATEVGAVIKSWSRLPQNEGDMAAYVAHHAPINVGFDATSWTCFTGGIMTNCEAQDLSHSATLVGYNDRNASLPYWIIKNEWSTAWGNAGYMWLIKGINACLIATDATVVTVAP